MTLAAAVLSRWLGLFLAGGVFLNPLPGLASDVPLPARAPAAIAEAAPKGLPTSDWQSIRAAHEAWRHTVMPVEGATAQWRARNPGQQWTTTFDGRGFETTPREAAWRWGLELRRFGVTGHERVLRAPTQAPVAQGGRLSYRWDETLQEWFVNDPRGLEHGFSVQARPPGPVDARLRFEMAVRGTLAADVSADALAVHFRDRQGAPVVSYTGLKVWDADGRILAACFEPAPPNVVVLSVDDRDARYPLTIDPVAQQAYLKPGPVGATQAGDYFGWSVAISGDTVIVGAVLEDSSSTGVNSVPNESATNAGAAFVFVRSGSTWTQQAYLKAPLGSEHSYDQFGFSVAISGDTAVVGARWEDGSGTGVNGTINDSAANAGAAYVFVRSGTTWTQQAYLKPAAVGTTQAGDEFGFAVAIAGDTIVVGAPGEDSSSTGVNSIADEAASLAGAAYVFTRSGTTWTQQAYLKPAAVGTTQAGDAFGYSVGIAGETILVGSPYEDSVGTGINVAPEDAGGANWDAGAAYVFTRSGTVWTQQAILRPSAVGTSAQGDAFGFSVSISAETAVVGAPGENSSSLGVNGSANENAPNAGAAYVFTRSGTDWTQQAYLKPAAVGSSQSGDQFGNSVAVAGDTIVVGAPFENSSSTGVNSTPDESAAGAGAAYVFTRSGAVWTQQAYLKPGTVGTTQAADSFGYSVALAGDTVVVGAPTEDSNAGGINGAPDENAANAGAATVYFRSGGVWIQQAFLKPASFSSGMVQSGDRFGTAVAISGDTVAVGASWEDSSTTGVNSSANEAAFSAGAVYIFVRSGGVWAQEAYLKPVAIGTSQTEDFFGASVGLSGDTLIVGAPFEDSGTTGINSAADEAATQAGAAYIFVRSGGVWTQQAYLKPAAVGTTQADDRFGVSVTVDGDTAVVGANREDSSSTGVNSTPNESATDAGAAYVFVRSGSVWTQQAYLKPAAVGTSQAGDAFGTSVSVSGDTVAVGAPGEDSSTTGVNGLANEGAGNAGAVYIFTRSGGIWTQQAYLKPAAVGTSQAGDAFGTSVALSGSSLLVGAPGEGSASLGVNSTPDEAAGGAGAAYVFTRSGTVWSQQAYLKPAAVGVSQGGDAFGTSVSLAADTAVVGAPFEGSSTLGVNAVPDEGASAAGAAYVFTRSGTTWTQQAFLKPQAVGATQAFDSFGASVGVSGDTAIVGAPFEDGAATGVDGVPDEGATNAGAAYVFTGLGPPSGTPGSVSLTPASLAEHNAPGATVGTLSATYPGAAGAHTFSFVVGAGDNDNAAFSISGSSLRINARADFETKAFYSLRIRATDSGSGTHDGIVFVTVTNVNDPPTFTIGPNLLVPATISAQAVAGFATGIGDGDGAVAQSLTFVAIVTSGAGLFAVAPALSPDGALTFTPNGGTGTATISVTLRDDDSIGGPGTAITTPAQIFSITFSNQANLASLSLSAAALAPVFTATTENYNASAPFASDSTTVVATPAQAGATLEVQGNGGAWIPLPAGVPSGPIGLNVGSNSVRVRVTQGGLARIYAVSLVRNSATPGSPVFLSQTLDLGAGGQTGWWSRLTVVNGNPAITFYNSTDQNLVYARNSAADGSGFWTVTTVEALGNAGTNSSLCLVGGFPAIAYTSSTGLRYIRANDIDGNSWGAPVAVDASSTQVGSSCTLLVVNGRPAIGYYDGTFNVNDLRYVRANDATGTNWAAPQTLESAGVVGSFASMAIVNGNPAMAYFDNTNTRLRFIRANDADGASWAGSIGLETSGFAGYLYLSLVVVQGNPAISYFDNTNGDLRYIRATDANGTAWAGSLNLESSGTVGEFNSLAVINGRPAISYYDRTNGDLKFLRANDATGAAWPASGLVVASAGDTGRYTSLAVTAGNPAISYQDTTTGDLRFIRALNADGSSWPGTSGTVDAGAQRGIVGSNVSQALVNGNPAIAYYDQTNRDLKYIRANDSNGTNWAAPVVVDSANFVGSTPSLAVVNGRPAVAYYDQTTGDLRYVRANDANGVSWGTPVYAEVNATAQVGFGASLVVVNGRPAIAYYDLENQRFRYVRAGDADGAAWGAPVTVNTFNSVFGQTLSMAVINGRPAICHSNFQQTDNDLIYVRANDADGLTWGTPVVVDGGVSAGSNPSLKEVNGRPAIAYLFGGTADLNYVRANDSNGASWGTPQVVDSTGSVGLAASLAIVDGFPAISYYDSTNGDLRYTRATDADGTAWSTPVTVDGSVGDVGSATSLIALGTRPAIAYYDRDEGNLKWAVLLLTPEIALSGNGNTIPNGDLTPDVLDHTDFGSILAAGAGAIVRTFTITNSGTGVLNLNGIPRVVVSGAQASDFAVSLQPAATVNAGGSTTFDVTFNPSAPGLRSATLSIASDDTDESPFQFGVQGTGINSSPSYLGYVLATATGVPANVSSATLLTRASDPDGGTPSLNSVSASSTQGGSVAFNAGTVTYTPPAGFIGLDTFTLGLADAHGGSASGLVVVNVGGGVGVSQMSRQLNGDIALLFSGLAVQVYRLERSVDLSTWTTIQTQAAASDGTLPILSPNPSAPKVFYRAISP